MECGTISGIEYPVFDNLKEYQDYHMERSGVVPIVQQNWRTAKKYDWVWSDDLDIKDSHLDYPRIVQLLHQKDITYRLLSSSRTTGHCRTIVGTFIQNRRNKMDTDLTLRKYPQGRYKLATTLNLLGEKERVKKRKNLTKKELCFCIRVATGGNPYEVYKEIYKAKNYENIKVKAILLLKQERIMNKIAEDLNAVREDLGINHRFVLERYLKILKKTKSEDMEFKVVEKLGDITGTHGEKQRVTATFGGLFEGFSPKQLEDAEMTQLPSGDKDEDES